MNIKMVSYMLGRIVSLEALLLLLPAVCSLIYNEKSVYAFLITIAVAAVLGIILTLIGKTKNRAIFAKEGFVIVALAWIILAAVGALPFYISREIPSYVDAFFETVSGLTTTGATVMPDVEASTRGILFWRSFTHWIGGMGVLVLLMAIFPTDTGRSMHIMRAEMPGPVIGKLVPKIKTTARVLYLIYIAFTLIQVVLLLCGGMPLYESVVYSMGTAGTGGFGVDADSITGYSPYLQWVITVFMIIFGVNFNLYYLVLTRKFRSAFKSEELWTYIGIITVSTAIIAFDIYSIYGDKSDSLRHSAFQVASIISTTGYATTDFDLWSSLSKGVLLLLMFIGACAGSTGGGLKVSRLILLFKSIRANLKHMLHPRSIDAVQFEGKKQESSTILNVFSYFALYIMCFAVIFLLISFEPFSVETNFSAVASCYNNIGPGFAAVGPMSNFAAYSDFAKIVLSYAMLLGRLELFPMLLLFSPSVWRKKRGIKRI